MNGQQEPLVKQSGSGYFPWGPDIAMVSLNEDCKHYSCITCEHDIIVLMLTFSSKHNCVSGQRETVASMVAVSYCCFCGKEKKDKLCPEYNKGLAAHPFIPVLSLLSFLTASLLSCSSSPTQNSWLMRQIKT